MVTRRAHRGFSLVEAIAALVIISITAPTALVYLNDAAGTRIDAAQITRAAWLTRTILEECAADAASEDADVGFDAMRNAAAYKARLRARVEPELEDSYDRYGLTWDLAIDAVIVTPLQGGHRAQIRPGQADADYRRIEVTVRWSDSRGKAKQLAVETVVARP